MSDKSDVFQYAKVGERYPTRECVISGEQQLVTHRSCGVDSARFGAMVDAGVAANLHNAIWLSLRDPATTVQLDQTIRQFSPLLIGEAFLMSAKVTSIEQVPRGHLIRHEYEFHRKDGTHLLSLGRTSLRLNDAGLGIQPSKPKNLPQPDPRTGFELVAHRKLTPEGTSTYSAGGTGLHKDQAFVQKLGLRAPLAAGMMGVHWVLEALGKVKPYSVVDTTVRMRRPMFWDDDVYVWGRADNSSGQFSEFRILNGQDKVLMDAIVRSAS